MKKREMIVPQDLLPFTGWDKSKITERYIHISKPPHGGRGETYRRPVNIKSGKS